MKALQKILITVALFCACSASAQIADHAIGLRGGIGSGITYQHGLSNTRGLEFILNTRWKGWSLTGLYEIHQPLGPKGLNFYYGVGAHVGNYGYADHWKHDGWDGGNRTFIGVDGIIGLEYYISKIPFNVSLDWKPTLHFIGYSGFWGDELALSLRFTF